MALVPSFAALAVTVISADPQMGLGPELIPIEIEGVRKELTLIVSAELVANVELAHGELELKIQFTTSPFDNVLRVKVELLVPTFVPFTCH